MSLRTTDVAKKAADLESKLKGKLFLEGSRPTEADVKAFNDLLGADHLNLYRWIKHMASFPEAERKTWESKKPEKAAKPVKAPKPEKSEKPADKPAAPAKKEEPKPAKDDDDMDLFGEETEEEKAALEAKKKADAGKKKAAPIAKSTILLDIKPWDDETDLKELARLLKQVERDGLVWGAHKLVPVAYGINKLQQLIVIEDDKISSDDLEDLITSYTDYVQSMDIAAWNKL